MKDEHVGIILERIEGKLDDFAEAMGHVPTTVKDIDDHLLHVEDDVKAIKAVVRDHSQELAKND